MKAQPKQNRRAAMKELRINPRFRALCPSLTAEERDQLERNLVSYGCREPLCVWDGQIVDV